MEIQKSASKRKEQLEAIKTGLWYVACVKGRFNGQVTVKDGVIVKAGQNVKHMERDNWSLDRFLDWADRSKVQLYLSDDGRTRGVLLEPDMPSIPAMGQPAPATDPEGAK